MVAVAETAGIRLGPRMVSQIGDGQCGRLPLKCDRDLFLLSAERACATQAVVRDEGISWPGIALEWLSDFEQKTI